MSQTGIQLKLQQAIQYHQQGDLEQARSLYKKIIKMRPGHFDALHLLGVSYAQIGDFDSAILWMDKALVMNPDSIIALVHRSNVLKEVDRLDSAEADCNKAIQLRPTHAEAYGSRGNIRHKKGKKEEALHDYNEAIKLNSQGAEFYSNRANALREFERFDEALKDCEQALLLDPSLAEAHYNRALIRSDLGQMYAAIDSYNKSVALNPYHVEANWDRALALLLTGNFSEGFSAYEWRWRRKEGIRDQKNIPRPLWLGQESLEGKRILLHSEQGWGDTIQFSRYAKLVAELGATVMLLVPPELMKLSAGLEGVHELYSFDQTQFPNFNFQCPLLSLPLALKTTLGTVPADIPYIFADSEQTLLWQERLKFSSKPKIGLVWSGGDIFQANAKRNIPFEIMAQINVPFCDFYSLQKGDPAESELLVIKDQYWQGDNLHNLTHEIHDFVDTAGLISQLDLLISVDTSVIHLAGAMGKPAWLLNRFDTCWRWMLERDDSPWYPSIRIFRQPKKEDWQSVIEQVRKALIEKFEMA